MIRHVTGVVSPAPFRRARLMTDELIDCAVCDGLGYVACDDGSEIQCKQCDGTGKVPAINVYTKVWYSSPGVGLFIVSAALGTDRVPNT